MELKRTFDILELYRTDYSELKDAFAFKIQGQWESFSATYYHKYAHLFACGMISKGYRPGDKIITISHGIPHWNIVDMGLALAGLVHVPVYPTLGNEETEYILRHSDARAMIISNERIYRHVKDLAAKVPAIENIYSFADIAGLTNWEEILREGAENEEALMPQLEKIKASVSEEDCFTIVYTSGTTGTPKGVMLSHRNIMSNVLTVKPVVPLEYGDRALSFLPFCHIYERMLLYIFQAKGASVYYAEGLGTIMNDMRDVHPRYMNVVPRILEKFYDRILSIGKDLRGIKRAVFFWAIRLGYHYNDRSRNNSWYNFKLRIARRLVFDKWVEAFGGKVAVITSGGASLQTRLARLFTAAGLRVCEGYGMTETSPVIAVNKPTDDWSEQKLGTVGPVIEGVEARLDDFGEIIVRGPSVMMGYYKDPESTRAVLDDEGWFHTGDIGEFVDGKFLKIRDRKKEIFKTSSGKYVAPQVIENKFKSSMLIEQLMVIGENEKFVSTLISPNFNHLHFYASKHKIHFRDNKELIENPLIIKRIKREVNIVNDTLGEHEKIKRFRLVGEEWSQTTGELSPTLKLRRNVIARKYAAEIREIYGREEKAKIMKLPQVLEKTIGKGMKKLMNSVNL